jgi:hypothetical protein
LIVRRYSSGTVILPNQLLVRADLEKIWTLAIARAGESATRRTDDISIGIIQAFRGRVDLRVLECFAGIHSGRVRFVATPI